jgi:hypothetical protein
MWTRRLRGNFLSTYRRYEASFPPLKGRDTDFAAPTKISKTILARKSGQHHEDRVASGMVMGLEILR